MLEEKLTVSVNEEEEKRQNEQSNISSKILKTQSKLSMDTNIEELQAVIAEVPLDKNLVHDNGDGHAKDKKYTVAYNYDRNELGRQGPYREYDPPRQGRYRQYDSSPRQGVYRQYDPPPPPPQPGYRQYDQPNFAGGGGYDMGPALDYAPGNRNNFVMLVMTLLLVMLLVTAAFLSYVRMSPLLTAFFQDSGWALSFCALIILMGLNYSVACSPCVRVPPCNFVFLTMTVIAMTIIAAQVTSFYRTEILLYSILTTAAVVFVCFLLAFSSFDFTSWMLYVVVIATAFSVLALIVVLTMFLTGTVMKPLVLIMLVVATMIEVIMLTIELQTVLGGRTVELSEDDYALGAFMLYTSIISIFLKMVQILGLLDDMSG